MPQFYCYHCGQHIDAHAELSGWEVDCPACGGALTVPGVLRTDPPSDADLEFDFVPLSAESSLTEPLVEKIEDKKEPAPAPSPTTVISPVPPPVATPAPTPAPSPPPPTSAPIEERHVPSVAAPEPRPEPTPPSIPRAPAAEPSPIVPPVSVAEPPVAPTSEPPASGSLASDLTAPAQADAPPTPAPEKPAKPHWEPTRKFVPLEDLPEKRVPMTTLPSTVIFMAWMFGSALALVGIILGAGQDSIIRDRCRDSMVFMLACALVVLALTGLAGILFGMLVSFFRQRKVGRMGSSFCMAVLALGLLLTGSGALWYRSGWPWLAPSLNSLLAPFKVTPIAKPKDKSSDEEK